ncbi:MAG: glycosyltransferase family 4 protein [Peptococcia bacterium]
MKILFVSTISNTINAFLIPHIQLLLKQGHKVDIACNVEQEISPLLINLGCKVHEIAFQRSPLNRDNFMAYQKIKRLVLSEEYELIHTHTPVASFLTRLACKDISKIKILYTAHGFHFYKGAPIINWLVYYPLEKLAARWTDGLITMNEEDFNIAKKLQLRNRTKVYKVNGVGINFENFQPVTLEEKRELRKQYGYNGNDFILIYAAELNYNKHQDLLIESIRILKDKIPHLKLLLAGSGQFIDRYKEQIKRLNLGKNVHLLGYRDDIANLLKISDLAVSSSRREGLPVNVMEAMAVGLPLVVTDCRGNRDLVKNGQNGYVVGTNDGHGFANAIEKIYFSTDLKKAFGEESRKLVKTYSWEKVKEQMANIYLNEV